MSVLEVMNISTVWCRLDKKHSVQMSCCSETSISQLESMLVTVVITGFMLHRGEQAAHGGWGFGLRCVYRVNRLL